MGGSSRGLFGGGQPLGRPGSSMPGPLTTRADATGTDIEIQQAEAEVGRVTAALESSKARLARLKRLKELGTARKPAADKAVEQPPGQIPKKAEAAAIEMQSEERGNLVIGFDRDRGRVRIVDLVKQSSRSYQASGSTKVVPVLGIGDTVLSLLLEGPEITEVAVYKASRGRWDIQKLSIPIRGKVAPMFGFNNTSAVALMIEAPEITEIAAYSYAKERWAIQKLRESIDGTVLPQVFEGMAIYSMGRLVYAFSDITGTWDVLEMRDKSPAAIHQTNAHDRVSPRYTLLQGDFLHSFDLNSGKWSTTSLEEKK